MKEFEGREEELKKILAQIGNSPIKEKSHLFEDFKTELPISIAEASKRKLGNPNKKDFYPAIIFIRVVLAANRDYNKHVIKQVTKIQEDYPNLKTFKDLNNLLKQNTQEEFYTIWGHKNLKKYDVLKDLLKAVPALRKKYKIEDDYELMKKWAEKIDLENIEDDIIHQIRNVALATIQHLRMDFGIDTVKPDQRVIEVLKRKFKLPKVNQKRAIQYVEALSEISGIPTRTIDLYLVNYGSGYYDNRVYNSNSKIRRDIANRLIDLKVDKKTIADGTELLLDVVEDLIKKKAKEDAKD